MWAAPSLCNSGQVTNITLSCSDDLKMLQCCRDGRDGLHGRDGLPGATGAPRTDGLCKRRAR